VTDDRADRLNRAIAGIREAHAQLIEAANELEAEAPEAPATVEAVRKEAAELLELMARFERAGGNQTKRQQQTNRDGR
jgi:hypothetical protein